MTVMASSSVDLTNERGSRVKISVATGFADDELTLTLTGPASTTENIVTRQEAEALAALILRFLGIGM